MKKNNSKKNLKHLKISYEEEEKLEGLNSAKKHSLISDLSDETILTVVSNEKNPDIAKLKCKLEILQKYEKEIEQKTNDKKYSNSKNQKDNFWTEWEKIERMRDIKEAPVDTMGVEYCADPKQDRAGYKFQTLISLLLSSQTKDPVTYAVMKKMIKHGLTVENINKTDENTLKEMIYGVSFHNNKTKYIKKLAEVLRDEYKSDTPEKYEEIIKLPGIGPKMAHLYIQCCCDRIEGIAVDTHVHRISNRLKWTNNTKTPEQTRKELESWLPKKHWADINYLLVGFGQTICKAVGPKCKECLLNNTCEFGINRLKEKNKTNNFIMPSISKIETENEETKNSDLILRKSKRKNSDLLKHSVLSYKRKKK